MDMDEEEELFEDALNDDEEEELALPSILAGISVADKKKLLQFKRNHTEREYEEEIERLIVPLQKKKQLEELRMMMGQESAPSRDSKAAPASTGKRGRPAKKVETTSKATDSKKGKKAPAKGRSKNTFDDDSMDEEASSDHASEKEEEDDDKFDSDKEGSSAFDESEQSDESDESDLFRSDEEAEISQRPVKADSTPQTGKLLGKRRRSTKSKSSARQRKASREDEDEDDFEEDDGSVSGGSQEGEDYDLGKFEGQHDLKHIKDAHRRTVDRGDATTTGGSKAKVFDSLAALHSHLQDQQRFSAMKEADDDEPAEHADYLRVTLRRDDVIRSLGEPFFEEFVRDAFVRVSLGNQNGVAVYKLAQIVGVERNQRADRLPSTSFQPAISTSTRLTVSIGGQIKDKQRISMLSNHTITPAEVDSFRNRLRLARQPELTKGNLRAIRLKLKQLSSHVYSHEEIQKMVSSRLGLNKAVVTDRTSAMERLRKKMQEAKASKDYDLLEKVGKEIELLEKFDEKDKAVYEKSLRRQVDLNRRMKEGNVKRDMAAGMRKRQEDQEAAAKGIVSNAVSDPFIRRETRPKILWRTGKDKNQSQESSQNDASGNIPADVAAVTAAAMSKKPKAAARDEEAWLLSDRIDADEIRRRIKASIGVDPIEQSLVSKKERYLQRVVALLPPKDSAEREALRGQNKSLQHYIELMNMKQ